MATEHWADEIGKPVFSSIAEMLAAVNVDFDRLSELRDDYESNQLDFSEDDAKELANLKEAAGGCEDKEQAQQRIEEDPLSIELGGWWIPSSSPRATEYRILLTSGGPAVRIVGELGWFHEPTTAKLEVQDWFKPWTEYRCEESVLLEYVAQLYLGE